MTQVFLGKNGLKTNCGKGRVVLAPFSPQFGQGRVSISKDHNSCVAVRVHSLDFD